MRMPSHGELFCSRYQILETLGEGGFARVYRAHDVEVGRDVALKVFSPHGDEYSDVVEARFMREARVLAELRDPHTITLFDFGQSPTGLRYMAFEYVRGEDLDAVVRTRGPLAAGAVAHVLAQLLASLREAHDAGVLHRDIKPQNVLVYEYSGDPFRVKLLDFGIARPLAADRTSITRTGRVVGTPRYMSPEQVGGEELTPATDLYSLGLVAFEMLTGVPAIRGTSRKEILQQQMSTDALQLPLQVAPAALREVIERMVMRDATDRYQAATDAMAELRDAAAYIAAWTAPPLAAPRPQAPVAEPTAATRNIRPHAQHVVAAKTVPQTEEETQPRPPLGRAAAAVLAGGAAVAVAVAARWPAAETLFYRLDANGIAGDRVERRPGARLARVAGTLAETPSLDSLIEFDVVAPLGDRIIGVAARENRVEFAVIQAGEVIASRMLDGVIVTTWEPDFVDGVVN